jgi:hypothetical protein
MKNPAPIAEKTIKIELSSHYNVVQPTWHFITIDYFFGKKIKI